MCMSFYSHRINIYFVDFQKVTVQGCDITSQVLLIVKRESLRFVSLTVSETAVNGRHDLVCDVVSLESDFPEISQVDNDATVMNIFPLAPFSPTGGYTNNFHVPVAALLLQLSLLQLGHFPLVPPVDVWNIRAFI